MEKEKLSLDKFFKSINTDYYKEEIEQLKRRNSNIRRGLPEFGLPNETVYDEEARKFHIRMNDKSISSLEKDAKKYDKIIYDFGDVRFNLKELASPLALLETFEEYFDKYETEINGEKSLSTSKIKFKSHERLGKKADKLSNKIYHILSKRMKSLELISYKYGQLSSITLDEFMDDKSIDSEYDIDKMFEDLKEEKAGYWKSQCAILDDYVKKLPEIKKCLDDPNEVHELKYLFSSLQITLFSSYAYLYEQLIELKTKYDSEFSRLGYDELLSKYKEFFISGVEWHYLEKLRDIFSEAIYNLQDDLINKKEFGNLKKFIYETEHNVVYKLQNELENLHDKHGNIQKMEETLEASREAEKIYNEYNNLESSLAIWASDKNNTSNLDMEEVIKRLDSLSLDFSILLRKYPKIYQKKYDNINVEKAKEIYKKGLKAREEKDNMDKKTLFNRENKNFGNNNDEEVIDNREQKQDDFSAYIEEEMKKLLPIKELTPENEQIRRKYYEEYLKAKYSGKIDSSKDFVAYLLDYPNIPILIIIYEQIERDMKRLQPIDHLTASQQQIRKDCYKDYLLQKYLFNAVDSSVSFLDYLQTNYKDLEWLILQEQIRLQLLDTVYESYMEHCISVGGKINTISFSEYAEKYHGYTKDDMLCIYSDDQAVTRGLQ